MSFCEIKIKTVTLTNFFKFIFWKRVIIFNYFFFKVETKPRFEECYTCFERETKTKVVHILVIFQDKTYFQSYHSKSLSETFHVAEHGSVLKNY